MSFTYLKKKRWSHITRDERFFCAELYFEIKKDIPFFLTWLNDNHILHLSKEEINSDWEVGYEVCFYRDFIAEFHYEDRGRLLKSWQNRDNLHSPKRTFDLALFNEKYLIIIEAKSFQGFESKQLEEFSADKVLLKDLLKNECPEIILLGLHSSALSPKSTTKAIFHNERTFTWLDMGKLYPQNPNFKRANREIEEQIAD